MQFISAAILALVAVVGAGKPAPVSVRVNPRVAMAGPRVIVTVFVKIEPHADNRYLTVGIASVNRAESTTEQLEGLDAPEVRTVTFKRLPAGLYLVRATIQRTTGEPIFVETTFCLSGHNVSCVETV